MKLLILISFVLFSCSSKNSKKAIEAEKLIQSIEISYSHDMTTKKYILELDADKLNKFTLIENNKELIKSYSISPLFSELSKLSNDWPQYIPAKISQKISLYSNIVLVFSSSEKKYIRMTAEKLDEPENFENFKSKFVEFLKTVEMTL